MSPRSGRQKDRLKNSSASVARFAGLLVHSIADPSTEVLGYIQNVSFADVNESPPVIRRMARLYGDERSSAGRRHLVVSDQLTFHDRPIFL